METEGRDHLLVGGENARLLAWLLPILAAALLLLPVAGARAATIPVTSSADSGDGSLRAAIGSANNQATNPGFDLIDATDVGGRIDLTSALATLTDDVEIRGPGASELTVFRCTDVSVGCFLTPAFRIFTISSAAEVTIDGLTVFNGLVDDSGGGIQNFGELTVEDSAVSTNEADLLGGGIANFGTLTVAASTVSSNRAGFDGGGIVNGSTGTVTVVDSLVWNNQADGSGGGIDADGTVVVENSTVRANDADDTGGGIRAHGDGTVTVRNSTVSGNISTPDANLSVGAAPAALTLRSTIVSDPEGGGENCPGPGANLSSEGFNLADDATCSLANATDQPDTEPLLGPLADNGGPTRTMALAAESPAVDMGIGGGLTTDQRGLPRPSEFPAIPNASGGDGSDIGAFELQAPTPPTPPPSNQPIPPPSNEFRFAVEGKRLLVTVQAVGTVAVSDAAARSGAGVTAAKKKKKKRHLLLRPSSASGGPGTIAVPLRLTKPANGRLRQKGKVSVRATIAFTPQGGLANSQAASLRIKAKRGKRK